MDKKQGHGFISSEVKDEHPKLGDAALLSTVLMPGGHGWGTYLPADQIQNINNFESSNCTNYGSLHAIGTLGKKLFGAQFQQNLSERYTGVMTKTTPQGNDPWSVATIIATVCGVIPDAFLPFAGTISTWAEYYWPNPMTQALITIGVNWLKKYVLQKYWVLTGTETPAQAQQKLMQALQYSTIGIAVIAWSNLDANGMYYSWEPGQNHWVELYDFVEGVSWSIFDSYDNTHKLLEWNFSFGQAIGYNLSLNPTGQAPATAATGGTPNFFGSIIKFFGDMFNVILGKLKN